MVETKSAQAKKQFYADGHTLPKCVNDGCTKDVVVREWKNWSIKSECTSCIDCRKNKKYIIQNNKKIIKKGSKRSIINDIIIHKKDFCENFNSHLGFKCPVNKEEWSDFAESLDLDHLDGNHMNNTPINVKTYCKLCHNRKSKQTGDWNSNKPSRRKID